MRFGLGGPRYLIVNTLLMVRELHRREGGHSENALWTGPFGQCIFRIKWTDLILFFTVA